MSFYTSGLKTNIVDASFDKANFQSVFRFNEDTVYLCNLRLLNVGVTGTTTTYNELTGAYGVIQSISLYDGNVLLDQVLECGRWIGWSNFNKSNTQNKSINNVLSKNALGFSFQDKVVSRQASGNIEATEDTTAKSWLSLKSVLPFLDASQVLPTNVYKNLRVVVQYTKDKDSYLKDTTGTDYKSLEPILIADEMMDSSTKDEMMKSYKGVNFVGLEHDRVVLNAVTPTAANKNPVQNKSFLVNGFSNKKINRMLFVNTPTQDYKSATDTNQAYSNMGSVSQLNQKLQLRVNGMNVYPGEGITRSNQRLARLTDNWGSVNTVSNETYQHDAANHFTDAIGRLGNLDYSGINLAGRRVNELQIQYSRTGQYDDAATAVQTEKTYNQQLIINMYAEVQKTVEVQGERYRVGYM